jgi:hypothetical protein
VVRVIADAKNLMTDLKAVVNKGRSLLHTKPSSCSLLGASPPLIELRYCWPKQILS